jgi:uncharacterized protein YaaQ
MKLMLIIVRDEDADSVTQELIQNEFRVTRMASTGGFLRRGNSTLLVGVEDEKVETVTEMLKRCCQPGDDQHRRATIFVLNMPYYAKI